MYNPLAAAGPQMREPQTALPAAVGAELERLEARLGQAACADARRQLAELGEAAAARVLRTIGESPRPVRTISGFIRFLANQEGMRRIPTAHSRACFSPPSREVPNDVMMQAGSPGHCMQKNPIEIDSPIQTLISTPRIFSTPSPVRDLSRGIENMAGPSGSPPSPIWVMPQRPTMTCYATANALREAASPQMLALEELEFGKIFMIFCLPWL